VRRRLLIIAQVVLLALIGNTLIAGAALNPRHLAPNVYSAQTGKTITQTRPFTPAGSGFTYQGSLNDGPNPANGEYDFVFTLYDALTGGNQVGSTLTVLNQFVTNGLFTVQLDFGAQVFQGDARWLEIAVRQTEGGGSYTTLTPRQALTPAPYALFALKTQGYKNVVVVAKAGGDFTSIQAALNSITDNSAANPYMVWVGPGTYTETVTMKPYVDIEGAGEDATTITYAGNASNTGTVVGSANAELRFLTVQNTGGTAAATAIYGGSSLSHVTAIASGGVNNTGVILNAFSLGPGTVMDNVVVHVSGASNATNVGVGGSKGIMNDVGITTTGGLDNTGLQYPYEGLTSNNVSILAADGTNNYGVVIGVDQCAVCSPLANMIVHATGGTNSYGVYDTAFQSTLMSNMTVTADWASTGDYGVYNWPLGGGNQLDIQRSTITGALDAVFAGTAGFNVRVGDSQLVGTNVGQIRCAGVYDGNYTFYPGPSCP
jgi:hypothetical protein